MQLQPESHGLWAATAPSPPETSTLSEAIETDIAIVGAGFTGMSAALHLSEAGIAVSVVEANAVGFGGSGRNAGLVNPGFWLPLPDMVKALGQDAAERMIDELGHAPTVVFDLIEKHDIQCEAVRAGNLHMAHSANGYRELVGRCEEWARRGAPVEMLDRSTAAEKTGTKIYHGAMLDRRAGTIQPLAYVRGLASAALKSGAKLFTQSAATAISHDGERWTVKTPGGEVRANRLLVATGGYGEGAEQARHSTVPYFYFQCATKPLGHNILPEILPDKNGTWDTHPVLKSFRLDAEGRLIFWQYRAFRRRRKPAQELGQPENAGNVPAGARGIMERSVVGRIAMTKDHLPRLKEIGPEGIRNLWLQRPRHRTGHRIRSGDRRLFQIRRSGRAPFPLTPDAHESFVGIRGGVIEMGARAFHTIDGWL